jgi:tRNA-dependent cyclodipeptide synthase
MELYTIRGGTKKELESKLYTIGVGISLGNKWFTVENIIEQIKWALNYSKKSVIIYVADSIHAINLEVRNRINHQRATKIALKMGVDLFEDIKCQAESQLSEEERNRLVYAKWSDLADESFKEKVNHLKSFYEKDSHFRDFIHKIVKDHISKEKRLFSDNDVNSLGQYIIEEMPEFLNRVPITGFVVDAYTYPFDNEITRFAEKIQKGELFPEIKENIIDTEPKVFLEVR